ncbi:transcriptional regulator family: SRF-type [Purpureocillium lilacinum]|uniref:Transcriptional regulator family: SRF-type n=1 Tax=Purpureocillium lilacinum TaxID=33203 RepID=A0ABR0BE17_PURLI|nr:transcriptional regulator family: SRF-type [Purpureocillium lilacinum]
MFRNSLLVATIVALIGYGTLSIILRQSATFAERGLVVVQISNDLRHGDSQNLTIGIWGSCVTFHDDVRCRKFGDGLSDLANSTSSVIGKMAGLGVGRLSDVAIVLIACAITMCCGLFFLRVLTFWAKAGVLFSVVLAVIPVVVIVVLFGIALSDIRGMGFAVESGLGMVCYAAFEPFVGGSQAQLYAAHAPCSADLLGPPSQELRQSKPTTASFTQPELSSATLVDMRRIRKNRSSKFSKRRRNFIKKAHELHDDCEVDVFVCVRSRRNNQVWQYSNGFEPPTPEKMVGIPAATPKISLTLGPGRDLPRASGLGS